MSRSDVIRAWKDPEFRLSLSESERAQLPAHPAGLAEMRGTQLEAVEGGYAVLVGFIIEGLAFLGGYIAGRYMDRLVDGPQPYACGSGPGGTTIMCGGY
jgi:mersacidin/lichenicidin family type 2 lantibiotic